MLLLVAAMVCAGAATGAREGPTAGAAGDEQDLAARGPMPPPGFLDGCLELIAQKRYEQARALLLPVVEDHPGWAKAHFYLALTYYQEHRYRHAQELLERVLRIDPEYHTPRVYSGWSLYYLGEAEQAARMFESYLAVKPGYADAVFALGLLAFDGDDVETARARFVEAAGLARAQEDKPTEAKARARLADVLVREGKLAPARDELNRSIGLDPDNYETYYKLSRVLQRLGDAEGAERARTRYEEVRAAKRPEESGGMSP